MCYENKVCTNLQNVFKSLKIFINKKKIKERSHKKKRQQKQNQLHYLLQ